MDHFLPQSFFFCRFSLRLDFRPRLVDVRLHINLPCFHIAHCFLRVFQADFYCIPHKSCASNPATIISEHFHGIDVNENANFLGFCATNNQIACGLPGQEIVLILIYLSNLFFFLKKLRSSN